MIRAIAHLFGWHTNACRGDYVHCYRPHAKEVDRGPFAGWWPDRAAAAGGAR